MKATVRVGLLITLLSLSGCDGGSGGEANDNSDTRQRIFVTSTTYNGNLGSLTGADITCTNVAAAAGITGRYQAVLSSSGENANTRIVIGAEVYMVQGGGEIRVAASSSAFWNNNHLSPININENGVTLSVMAEPWTGTNPGGTTSGIALTCQDWTDGSNANLGSTGDTSTPDASGWVNANGFVCNTVRPLYCIEETANGRLLHWVMYRGTKHATQTRARKNVK